LTYKTIGVGFEFKYQGNVEYAVIGDSRLNLLEKDVALKDEQTLSKINPRVYRPAEVELLIGNSANAKDHSGWRIKAMLEQLCQRMVQADFGHNTKEPSF
jgi:GDPmannose 4,6-dehydratase